MGNNFCFCFTCNDMQNKNNNINISSLNSKRIKKLDDEDFHILNSKIRKEIIEHENSSLMLSKRSKKTKKKDKIENYEIMNNMINYITNDNYNVYLNQKSRIYSKFSLNEKNNKFKRSKTINHNEIKKESIIPIKNKLLETRNTNEKTIAIYGPSFSGKTSFVIKYLDKKYDDFYIPSVNDEIIKKNILINGKLFKMTFIVSNNLDYIYDADCYFIFYDMNNQKSYDVAEDILKKIIKLKKLIFFIGNKLDIKLNILKKDNLENIIKKNHGKIFDFEISVKEEKGIKLMMEKFKDIFNYEYQY